MRIILFVAALGLMFTLISCKDKNKSIYEGCCGTEPITISFFMTVKLHDIHGNLVDSTIKANAYIPNLITNDNDGDNDVFMVFGGPYAISKIISMNCYYKDGMPLFHNENFQPNDASYGWDGLKQMALFIRAVSNTR